MIGKIQDIVVFREDRLFDGAVDVEWFLNDKDKARLAAESFVFHGPTYHGVSQQDIGTDHGHRLVDTATFVYNILRRCNGSDDQPFTLAIAGYGTGKSHLAMTLATLLSEPAGQSAEKILTNIESADSSIGNSVRYALREVGGTALVISLNGMGNFDLASEFTRQIMYQLKVNNIDSRALDDLRPRFKIAANLVKQFISNDESPNDESLGLRALCNVTGKSEILDKLEQHDEAIYEKVFEFFASKGIPIRAIGDETVKDVLETVCNEYCGDGKPFNRVVVLFDEFGRYAEFATVRSQVAGSGVLQHLFEGIQSNSSKATFIGFIQFDLNTYVQRIGQEFKNEILRVSTRYQSADKAYLSINLETLIANLIEKKDQELLSAFFDRDRSKDKSIELSTQLRTWFPRACNHHLWCDVDQFHQVVRKGCWPLSPYASWFLFHLAAAGQHLQQRSALALLGDAFERNQDYVLDDLNWEMSAVDLWSDSLQTEFLTAEESGSLGTITHSYSNIMARNGHQFSEEERRLLQAIVLASKMGLNALDRLDAVSALAALSGVSTLVVEERIGKLESDYNVISWDASFKQFEILGDAVSRPQFLSFLRQRVNSTYDERGKAQLFARRAGEWGSALLIDQVCDFAERNRITTNEWVFEHAVTNLDELPQVLVVAAQNWTSAYAVDAARGTIVYCYAEPSRDLEREKKDIAKLLREISSQQNIKALPILVVLLPDEQGLLGQYMAELAILSESLDEQDKVRFGNLVGAHKQNCQNLFQNQLEVLIKGRHYVTAFTSPIEAHRLSPVCSEIFNRIYPKVLSFPFDGFSTSRGNAADSCVTFTSELLNGVLDYTTVEGKAIKEKNRALEVLSNTWKIFSKNGSVSRRPAYDIARAIIQEWEDQLIEKGGSMSLGNAIKSVCKPPFGANIASAGLLLGVFIRARKNDFSVIANGQPTDFSYLANNGLFRGKFLDLNKLENIFIEPATKEGASEWDSLLDDWERASGVSYKELIEGLCRAHDLKNRLPVPSAQVYRYEHLENRAKEANNKILDFEEKIEEALSRIDHGDEKNDIRNMTYGGSLLQDLLIKMRSDPMWDSESPAAYEGEIERVRQRSIQIFDLWLSGQSPNGRTTKDVSEFERKMVFETGRNLNKLGLEQLNDKLKQHVDSIVRNINIAADANELINKVAMWITEHEPSRLVRIAEIRNQKDIAKEYIQKISSTSKKISLPELDVTKQKLSEFIKSINSRESEIGNRAKRLWNNRFTIENLEDLTQEVEDLERIYEGCDIDLIDLRILRRALHFYRDVFKQLSSDILNEEDLETLANELKSKGDEELVSDEPPWMPEETINIIIKHVKSTREAIGKQWFGKVEPLINTLNNMDAPEANDLFNKLSNPPAYLSKPQRKELSRLLGKVEQRLNQIKIEWLVARYKELEELSRKEFLKQIGIILEQRVSKPSQRLMDDTVMHEGD